MCLGVLSVWGILDMQVSNRIRVMRILLGSRRREAILITILCLSLLLPLVWQSQPVRASSSYSSTILGDSPAAYWRLGEGSGTTMNDASPNGNNGAYAGSFAQGQVGAIAADGNTAINFTGGHGLAPTSSSLSITGAVSVEAWIKWTATPTGVEAVLEKGDGVSQATSAYELAYIPSLGFGFYDYIGSNYAAALVANPPPAGVWYHVVGTRTAGGSLSLYENGSLVASGSDSGGNLNAVSSGVGVAGTGGTGQYVYPFNGTLDEVAVYPSALSATQVANHWSVAGAPSSTSAYSAAVSNDGPSTYWRLDERTGSTMADLTTNANNGTYHGGATLGQPGLIKADAADTAVLFDGSTGYAQAPSTTSLRITGAVSIEAWVTWTSPPLGNGDYHNTQAIVEKGDGSTRPGSAYELGWLPQAGGLGIYTYIGNGYGAATWSGVPAANTLYYLVGTRTASGQLNFYVNGVPTGSGTDGGTPLNDVSSGVGVGASGGSGSNLYPFNGTVDEVAIYPYALTQEQVTRHYQASGQTPTTAETLGKPIDTNATTCHAIDPCDTATGNFSESITDLSIAGRGVPLVFNRTYNSFSASQNGPLGYGWTESYNAGLSFDGSGNALVHEENGSTITFAPSGSGGYQGPTRVLATLVKNGDGTYTLNRRDQTHLTFSSSGQLIKETDRNGYATTLTYSTGNPVTVTDPASRTLTLSWSGGHVTSVTDANVSPSRTVQYQYNDGAGNLTDVIDVNGGHWQYTYDASHRMTVMKDPKCYATSGCPGVQNSYDSNGRVQWQKDQLNRQTSFSYASNQTTMTDPKGNVTVFKYQSNELIARIDGYGTSSAATTYYTYDLSTLGVASITDPNGNVSKNTYDAAGNLLTQTDGLGRTTTYTYDAMNDVLTFKDPLSVTTTNVYNGNGNLTSSARPLTGTSQTQTTTYNYADSSHPGDVTSMVDPDSKTWTYAYDSYGNRNSVSDPLGNKATSVFNADSWLTSSVTPKGNVSGCGCQSTYTTTYAHDAFGNLTTATDPLGHQTIRHYDADQNLDAFTDGDGNKTTYIYDVANQQTQIQRPDTTTLTTDYNADGTVLDQKDGKNNAILTYGYDALRRVTSQTDALGNVTSFTYDGAGNRLTKQDPGGNCAATPKTGCTSFTYDAANQLKAITYSDGVTPNVTNITYDSDGQRTGMTDGTGTSAWAWDSLHRLTSYTNGNGAQVQYAYNLRNLPTTITYPGSLNVTRGYDDAGRFTSVRDWLSNTTTFGYDPNSNLTTETLPSGTGIVDTFTVDAADRLMGISDVKGGTTTLFAATYTRDNANQVTSDSSAPSATGSYKYNTLNQVCYAGSSTTSACSSPPSGATAYAYDAGDNLTQMGGTQQAFNAADELCWTAAAAGTCAAPPTGATTYTNDTRGNRTKITLPSGAMTTLSYDQGNRLIAYGSAATYAYNGDGLRMSKTVSGTTSQFVWDVSSNLPLDIKDGSTAYIFGPQARPIEQINASTAFWLHHDQLGTTRLVSDSSGANQATYTFDAYGNLATSSGTAAIPVRFAGEYLDAESGLYYLRSRLYDPSTGQFISLDPAVTATREPYAYVHDNPMNGVDPTGLDWGAAWDALIGGVVDVATHPHPLKDYAEAESQLPGVVQMGDAQLFQMLYRLQQQWNSGCESQRMDAIDSMAVMTMFHGRNGTFTTDEAWVFRELERHHGISPKLAGFRLHAIKRAAGREGDANVVFDLTGNVYDPDSGEVLGSLTQGGGDLKVGVK